VSILGSKGGQSIESSKNRRRGADVQDRQVDASTFPTQSAASVTPGRLFCLCGRLLQTISTHRMFETTPKLVFLAQKRG
jgi:hypothetical protein